MKRLLFAISVASGCSWQPRVWEYRNLGFKIVALDQRSLEEVCDPEPGMWDDGNYRPPYSEVAGCADRSKKTIYIENSCLGAKAITHELKHLDHRGGGKDDPRKEGYSW